MSFNALAIHYRWMEALLAGDLLQRCRTACLDRVGRRDRLLLCGEGPGRFLQACRQAHPTASITCVDASSAMLNLAAERLRRHGHTLDGIEFVEGDALKLDFGSNRFDLIVTHFFLDCFTLVELEGLIPRLARSARHSSAWLIADFRVPPSGIRRLRARLIHSLMYWFFGAFTGISARSIVLPDPILESQGFRQTAGYSYEWGLLRSEVWIREGLVQC